MKPILRPIALAAFTLLASLSGGASAQDLRRPYIVQLQDQPAASYTGGIAGLPATQPAPGTRFQLSARHVQDYLRYLDARKASVLASIGGAPVIANYEVVINGFAAMLTDADVLALRANAAVIDVQADQARHVDTISTPRFLGLSASGGLWSQLAGGAAVKGEDMVIGVIDTGIWPENPAFADRVDGQGAPTFDPAGTLAYTGIPAGFAGSCQAGEGFDPARHCNNKLIGAKFYTVGLVASGVLRNWSEFLSPRDSNVGSDGLSSGHGGHGDHTASTAAGNANNAVTLAGVPMGLASGMAPRARVAAYKICWTYDDPQASDGSGAQNSCFTSDSVLAIDDAVKDGVNVINYSIGGVTNNVSDIVEQAFYRAALAGVFVAASGGNSGPAAQVAHLSPWITTVAASTHDRSLQADVTLGSGVKYTGASLNTVALGTTPLAQAENAGLGNGASELCYSDAAAAAAVGQVKLDPAKVQGKIVICTRGFNARVDKSLAVLQAGGVGMVLVDNDQGLIAEIHAVPTVHVSSADGNAIKLYAAGTGAGARAAITPFYAGAKPAPFMAGFSSRGPNGADANVLKPDLTAPGVDLIASVTPALTPAQHGAVASGALRPAGAFDTYSGTSMSSPHVAGVALLLRQAHPDWSPAAVKSALMTSAYDTLDDGLPGPQNGRLPWSQGAGHITPNKAVDPGLVYDAGIADYVAYQCKLNRQLMSVVDCATYGTLDETYNLNLPSITVGAYLAPMSVRRSVTNVGAGDATYRASVALPGFTAVVSPPSLTLAAGASASFTLALTRTSAVQDAWNYGSLSWTSDDGSHVVHSPVQVRASRAIIAPDALTSDKLAGAKLFSVKTAFSGRMTALRGGLKAVTMGAPVTLQPAALSEDQVETPCAAGLDTASVKAYPMTIPANTVVARFALRQADTSDAGDDNDLFVRTPGGSWLVSGNAGSNESVEIASPAAGTYMVCVNAYASRNAAMTHQLSSWIVTTADAGGHFTVAMPSKAVAGNNVSIGMGWSGLGDQQRYLGAAQLLDPSGEVQATTSLRIETGVAAIAAADGAHALPKGRPQN